jgi:hypothetical protein
MRTVTVELKAYEFGELKEGIREILIDKAREDMESDYCEFWLENDMHDQAGFKLQEITEDYKIKDISYSFGYSQSDGACVEFDVWGYDFLLHVAKDHPQLGITKEYVNDNLSSFNLTVKQSGWGYGYALNMEIEYQDGGMELDEEELEDIIDTWVWHFNKDLERWGKDSIEYYWKVENVMNEILSDLRNNEYTEDGEIFQH